MAVVTGASRGIGEAIARGLAEQGATVVVSSRKQAGLNKVAASIEAEKSKKEVLSKKFTELFEKTKGDASKPVRDIDLD